MKRKAFDKPAFAAACADLMNEHPDLYGEMSCLLNEMASAIAHRERFDFARLNDLRARIEKRWTESPNADTLTV